MSSKTNAANVGRFVFTRLDGTKVRVPTHKEKTRREKLQAAAARRQGLVPFETRRGTRWLPPAEVARREKLRDFGRGRSAFGAIEQGQKTGRFVSSAQVVAEGRTRVLRWTLVDGRRIETSKDYGAAVADAIDRARDHGAARPESWHRYKVEWRATWEQYGEQRSVAEPSPLAWTEKWGDESWMSIIWWRLMRQRQGRSPTRAQLDRRRRGKPSRADRTAQKKDYPKHPGRDGQLAIPLSPAPRPDAPAPPPEQLKDLRLTLWLIYTPRQE